MLHAILVACAQACSLNPCFYSKVVDPNASRLHLTDGYGPYGLSLHGLVHSARVGVLPGARRFLPRKQRSHALQRARRMRPMGLRLRGLHVPQPRLSAQLLPRLRLRGLQQCLGQFVSAWQPPWVMGTRAGVTDAGVHGVDCSCSRQSMTARWKHHGTMRPLPLLPSLLYICIFLSINC